MVIRNARGNNAEALNQLTLLFAAQLERMLQLHNIQGNNERGGGHPLLPPVVGFTIVGHHWSCYIGYRGTVDGQEKVISVLPLPIKAKLLVLIRSIVHRRSFGRCVGNPKYGLIPWGFQGHGFGPPHWYISGRGALAFLA